MSTFKFTDEERKILKNFSGINLSTIIKPGQFSCVSNSRETVGLYDLQKECDFEEFGVYDLNHLNNMISAVSNPEFVLDGNILRINDLNDVANKWSFNTSPMEGSTLPNAKEPKISGEPVCVLNISAESLAVIGKQLEISKHETITLESFDNGNKFHLIASDVDTTNSEHICSRLLKENEILVNDLKEKINFNKVQFSNLLGESDYKVEIFQSPSTGNYMSKWVNVFVEGLRYYISLER